MVRVRLPLGAILLALCSLALAASSSDAPRGGFADFYRQQQARLLSHIDDTLATQAERAITGNFAAVKSAGVQLQTGLGGRKGNIGINVIGAFDESDSRAFGWQLRGYGGEDSTFGANAGIFYRKIDGDTLFGANAFADYEDGDYGNFTRLGFGGELGYAIVGINANYYLPITDESRVNATVAAFSRQGFDAKLRVSAPGYEKLKAAVEYYNFDGKRGTQADDGLRSGIEFQPFPALRIGAFYDDGAKKFGGELSYSHTIGEAQQWQSNDNYAPDLFAPVSREYSQRIATVAAGPAISLRITPMIITTAMTTAARTITTTRAAGLITITTRMTAAGITTTTTMTAASITTTMTMTNTMATRMASVGFTVADVDPFNGVDIVATSTVKLLVTLPPPATSRPWVLTITTMLDMALGSPPCPGFPAATCPGVVVESAAPAVVGVGAVHFFGNDNRAWSITIVEGSEDIISVAMTTETTMTMMGEVTETTMTMAGAITETTTTMALTPTTTTMTILPVSTTTRITTFATMFITLTANAAMGELSSSFPVDSAGISKPKRRFPRLRRENDDDSNNKGGGITKPPLAIGRMDNAMVIALDGVITNRRPSAARHSCQLTPIRRFAG